jgi:DNA repair exonuclease SbcCD ATPase subunit
MNRSKSVLNKNYKSDSNPLNEVNNEDQNDNNNSQTKTDLPEVKTFYGNKSPYSLKLQKIIDELSKIDPDSLMKQVDPTINSTKTIKQIQTYYNNIKKEISTYIRQERLEEELKKEINRIPKQIEMLVHPPKSSTIPQNENKTINDKDKDKDNQKENKPVIDYHYKLKNLETEIGHSYQKFNTIKSKNNKLLIQLEEIRKENLFYINRLSELKKELKEKEDHYNATKAQVEERMNDVQEKEKLKEILQKQEILSKRTEKMKDDILDNNSDYIEKMAKNNYLDFQKKELEKLIKNLEQKRAKENEKFNKEINIELDKIKVYQKESKILKELDKEKMDNLEELFKEIL